MKTKTLKAFILITLILNTLSVDAKLTLIEIRSASKDILVAFFSSDTLNLNADVEPDR